MGCCGSGDRPAGLQAPSKVASLFRRAIPDNSSFVRFNFLDYYQLGEMLGQGAFGVVYACKPLGKMGDKSKLPSNAECAVKMVDKVETPEFQIKEEADMLARMDHPNVLKCYDVIYEKCFVCIVTDRLKGGDLIKGMQAHWKERGKIPVMCISKISAQLTSGLHYIHSMSIIHRDVKGDNYLMDRPDIVDPECRILLCDFGTADDCTATDRLTWSCGTKLYWAPEFYKLNYSLPVDLWAMGVIMYGLINGKFPFKNEIEVKTKKLIIPKGVPVECADLVKSLLHKDEFQRADTKMCISHPWIVGKVAVSGDIGQDDGDFQPEDFSEGGPNMGIQHRREELVERIRRTGNMMTSAAKKEGDAYLNEWFTIVDHRAKNTHEHKYEWWSDNKVDEAGLLSIEGAKTAKDAVAPTSMVRMASQCLGTQLRDHGISTAPFGTGLAKTLEQLGAEVESGSAVLMLDASQHKKLVRVVDVVCLRICAPGDKNKFMVETGKKFADGRMRTIVRLPATKKEPHMSCRETAEMLVDEVLDLGGAKVTFDFDKREVFEEQEESPSFPGVMTVYRKEIIEGVLHPEDPKTYIGQDAATGEWSRRRESKSNVKYFAWKSAQECSKSGVKYKAPEEGSEISGLVQAPIGLEEEEVRKYFEANNIDVSKFGIGQAKTLRDISIELFKGKSSLMQDLDGSCCRTVDVVVIKLIHSVSGSILVQTEQTFQDGTKASHMRLPASKRRPDENQFLTARRVLKHKLNLDENHVTLSKDGVMIAEEERLSVAYPGLRTIYRKRIITATLHQGETALTHV